jgi:hypothetical protein
VALGKEILVDFWLLKSKGNIPLHYLDTHWNVILKSFQRNTTKRLDWLYMAKFRDMSRNLVKTAINVQIP